MARNYHDLYKKLSSDKDDITRVICAGGIARKNPVLMNLISQEFQLPCVLTRFAEDTLVGLYLIALTCSGKYDNMEKAQREIDSLTVEL